MLFVISIVPFLSAVTIAFLNVSRTRQYPSTDFSLRFLTIKIFIAFFFTFIDVSKLPGKRVYAGTCAGLVSCLRHFVHFL